MPINLDRLRTGGAFGGPLAQNALPVAPALRELTPGDRIGAFRIERELSRGGMGIVYLAERADGEFAQRVALKWLAGVRDRETAEALFRRERDIVAGLEHPGIARLIDGGRSNDEMLWFAMELVEGEPIDRWCEQRVLSHARRVALVVELTEALGFAHQRLLIHRDIKPSNVLVGTDGRVKLLDFGIARLLDQTDVLGQAALTPGYASPEQWAGGEITVASDVYQVGLLLAVLLDVLDPVSPASHATRTAQEESLLAEPVAIDTAHLSHLPRDLAAIVQRATALEPAQRYASVLALGDDLQRWLQRRPVAARDGGLGYRLHCAVRRHPMVAAAALLAMAALLILGWRLTVERNHAQSQAQLAVAQAERARASLEFMRELLSWATPQNNAGMPVTVDAALERGVAQLGDRLADRPRLRAELLYMLGDVYAYRREPDRALPLLEAAHRLQLELPELDPFEVSVTATRLGNMLGSLDRPRSIALFERSIAAMQGQTDIEPSRLRVASRRLLAGQYYQTDQLGRAREIIDAALLDAEACLPTDDPEMFELRRELSVYLHALGRVDLGAEIRRKNYEHARSIFGPAHPTTSNLALALAQSLNLLGQYAQAAALIESDKAVRRRLWGEKSADYARSLNQEALAMLGQGQVPAARDAIARAVDLAASAGSAGKLLQSTIFANQSAIGREAGDLAAAEVAIRKAIDPTVRSQSSARDYGQLRTDLVGILRGQGRFDEIPVLLVEIEREMTPLPADHLRRGVVALETAFLELHRGDPAAARSALVHATALIEASPSQVARERALADVRRLGERLQSQ